VGSPGGRCGGPVSSTTGILDASPVGDRAQNGRLMAVRFDPEVLRNDPEHRRRVLEVLSAAVSAVDPVAAVGRHLERFGATLRVGEHEVPVPSGRIVVLAVGKAAVPMARSAVSRLDGLSICGAVAAPEAAEIPGLEVMVGGHPLPDEGSLRAGRRLLELAHAAGPDDLVLVLISGGGSALAEYPLPGLELADLRAVSDALLRAGAPIAEINLVRRHLSALKGGRLAAAAAPARLAGLVVSDVIGSALEVIAGGPTVPDSTSAAEALDVLSARGVVPPGAVSDVLQHSPDDGIGIGAAGGMLSVIADGSMAARAACEEAKRLGLVATLGSTSVEGEAAEVGRTLAEDGRRLAPGVMLIHAGETTVTVSGRGRGGRNQELALAAGIALEGHPGILVAGFGTDGIDGPTPAAGGIGDAGTASRGWSAGRDARVALETNDSATFLEATGDQLRCGATGTNVGDLMVVYRDAG